MIEFLQTGDATVIVAVIVSIAAPLILGLRNRKDLREINRAVNHVPLGSETLIQRVTSGEIVNAEFRSWIVPAVIEIAKQVGTRVDPPPATVIEHRPPRSTEGT